VEPTCHLRLRVLRGWLGLDVALIPPLLTSSTSDCTAVYSRPFPDFRCAGDCKILDEEEETAFSPVVFDAGGEINRREVGRYFQQVLRMVWRGGHWQSSFPLQAESSLLQYRFRTLLLGMAVWRNEIEVEVHETED